MKNYKQPALNPCNHWEIFVARHPLQLISSSDNQKPPGTTVDQLALHMSVRQTPEPCTHEQLQLVQWAGQEYSEPVTVIFYSTSLLKVQPNQYTDTAEHQYNLKGKF